MAEQVTAILSVIHVASIVSSNSKSLVLHCEYQCWGVLHIPPSVAFLLTILKIGQKICHLVRANLSQSSTPQPRRPPSKVPQCGHSVMQRIYGKYKCNMCNEPSPIGWVYLCKEDAPRVLPKSRIPQDQKPPLRKELETIGLNEWVIKAIEDGHYTNDQIEILKQQKLHVKATIAATVAAAGAETEAEAKAEEGRKRNRLYKIVGRQDSKTATLESSQKKSEQEAETAGTDSSQSTSKHSRKLRPPCRFRCCHLCRPAFSDRIYVSFESAFYDELPPLSTEEIEALPTISAKKLRTVGLRDALSSPTDSVREQALEEHLSPQIKASSSFVTSMPSLGTALEDAEKPTEEEDRTSSEPSQESSTSTDEETTTDEESASQLPIGYDGFLEDESTLFEPTFTHHQTTEPTGTAHISTEDEIKAHGGVALTEEAVEMKMPDMITRPDEDINESIADDSTLTLEQLSGIECRDFEPGAVV